MCGRTVWPKYVRDVAVPWGFVQPWWEVRLRGAVPLGSAKWRNYVRDVWLRTSEVVKENRKEKISVECPERREA